jgi:predicted MFS family arabinose efflux permease
MCLPGFLAGYTDLDCYFKTGAAVIALGYANLVIIPFSNIFGRRLTSLICAMTCVLSNIWQAVATSYGSFLAARVVSGLGAAANESIMTVVVADVIFLHQRGSWMGLYLYVDYSMIVD